MDWQTALVIAIELVAVAFLVQRLVIGRRAPFRRPTHARGPSARPDVAASALVRKRR